MVLLQMIAAATTAVSRVQQAVTVMSQGGKPEFVVQQVPIPSAVAEKEANSVIGDVRRQLFIVDNLEGAGFQGSNGRTNKVFFDNSMKLSE